MSTSYEHAFYDALQKRMDETVFQQFAPQHGSTGVTEDPITGRQVLRNTARSQRRFELKQEKPGADHPVIKVEDCHFCSGNTPSTLFYIGESETVQGGKAEIAEEQLSLLSAKGAFGDSGIPLTGPGGRAANIHDLGVYYEMLKRSKPLVFKDCKAKDWLWRSFFNLTPSFAKLPSNCILLAAHPEYHYLYLDQFPPSVVASMIEGWKVWEGYVEWHNENNDGSALRVLPFVNGGKRPEAGQTMFCFHSQVYITPVPILFRQIQDFREQKGNVCPICTILNQNETTGTSLGKSGLEIYRNATMSLCMHPAPLRNFAMIAMPYAQAGESEAGKKGGVCISRINDLVNADVADVLQRSIAIYRRLMGKVPAYNISVRCGPEIVHLHIQIVPKTETNILAGYEDITRQIVITQDPEETANTLRRRYA